MADIATLQQQTTQEMTEVIESFKTEMQKIRIGSVNIEVVKNISVEAYGSYMPMYQVATITSPSAASMVITPWDKGLLNNIASAIGEEFKKEINPNIKDNSVFINFPPLTQEKKEEFVKVIKEKGEQFRQRLRDVRQEIKSDIEALKTNGEAPEDVVFKALEALDETTKKFTEQISEIYENKKEQLLK
ncbi:MAG: ribosome-recycling factor [Candidatus Dojkabacteria bacterium]|nr:MAG: ribosome-recycling factor [Candidatus Dojkabacteria bacterium]